MKDILGNKIFLGSTSCFLGLLGVYFTYPFLQAQRDLYGCDALCYGSMQSLRSLLSLFGTFLICRLSDKIGRLYILWLGDFSYFVSCCINFHWNSLDGMWLAMIPSAILNQNYSVMKALFADVSEEYKYAESDRAVAIGRLGMAAGLAFMFGPAIGVHLFSSYNEALIGAMVLTFLSSFLLIFIRDLNIKDTKLKESISGKSNLENIFHFLYFPALSKPGSRLLLFIRFCMSFAYSIFMTVWTVSLRARFAFGPKDHAYLMGWVGLWYAFSQGFLSKRFISFFRFKPILLLEICVICLSLGRIGAYSVQSVPLLYLIMIFVIVSLGIMNTTIAVACTRLAGKDEVGGLYGAFEAMESIGGIIGPILGGLLQRYYSYLPVICVVIIYGCVFVAIRLFYEQHILSLDYVVEKESTEKNNTENDHTMDSTSTMENKKNK